MPALCNSCSRPGASKVCSRCKCAHYCNVDCQRSDWREHRKVCKVHEAKSMIICSTCKQELEASKFSKNQLKWRKWSDRIRCKSCIKKVYQMNKAAEKKKEEDMKSMKSLELLLCGYIGRIQRKFKLSYNIPDEIYCLIDMFYPKLLKFQIFSSEKFKLSNMGYDIEGKSDEWNPGFMIYPLCLSPNGYSKGIHYWTIQMLTVPTIRTIGVLSERDIDACQDEQKAAAMNWKSCIEMQGWKKDFMTLRLNCDEGNVEYYKNFETQWIQRDEIDKGGPYFFALYTNCYANNAWFRVVETPSCIP